nr:hypothetical protein [Tanacetum cinerariifolium]
MPKVLSLAWETILKIELAFEDKHCQPEDILELFRRLHNDVQNIHEELAVYINTPSWDFPTICYNDDDDEDYTIAITPKEPDNSLRTNETDFDPKKEACLIKRLLYDNLYPRPPEEIVSENSDAAMESFSPFPIPVEESDSYMEEIDLSFTPYDPMPPNIEEDDYDSKRDILILEELLSNDFLSLPENESFHFDIPSSSRPPAKPPDGNS